jgi:hypothetical protein
LFIRSLRSGCTERKLIEGGDWFTPARREENCFEVAMAVSSFTGMNSEEAERTRMYMAKL